MQKVYLLLRSNTQSGPYTLDELLQFNLKPLDLVWVEGKSFGWSYPSEIESLKAFVEAPKKENPQKRSEPSHVVQATSNLSSPVINKKIFVSMPLYASQNINIYSKPSPTTSKHKAEEVKEYGLDSTSTNVSEYDHIALEKKAEEIRLRAQTYASSKPTNDDAIEIKYSKTLEEVEEKYTSWVYQKKTKKNNLISKEQLMSTLAVIIVIAGGWFIGSNIFNGRTQSGDQVVQVQNSVREDILPIVTENLVEDIMMDNDSTTTYQVNTIVVSKPQQKKELLLFNEKDAIENMVTSAPIQDQKQLDTFDKPSVETEEPVAEAEQPKKKTLGESVSNVFRKLIKNEEAETKTESSGSERKSSRREEITPAQIDISDQVDIKMNNNKDNWMMGVFGLKLTLHNQSPFPLKSAEIEVLYYNDQNKLLDKKKIIFSNIASKKFQTLSAPDHRLADHAEYKIISATGMQDAYVKN